MGVNPVYLYQRSSFGRKMGRDSANVLVGMLGSVQVIGQAGHALKLVTSAETYAIASWICRSYSCTGFTAREGPAS